MVKCKVNDQLEITITADINNLSIDDQIELLRKTEELAENFAEKLGYKFEKRVCVVDE